MVGRRKGDGRRGTDNRRYQPGEDKHSSRLRLLHPRGRVAAPAELARRDGRVAPERRRRPHREARRAGDGPGVRDATRLSEHTSHRDDGDPRRHGEEVLRHRILARVPLRDEGRVHGVVPKPRVRVEEVRMGAEAEAPLRVHQGQDEGEDNHAQSPRGDGRAVRLDGPRGHPRVPGRDPRGLLRRPRQARPRRDRRRLRGDAGLLQGRSKGGRDPHPAGAAARRVLQGRGNSRDGRGSRGGGGERVHHAQLHRGEDPRRGAAPQA